MKNILVLLGVWCIIALSCTKDKTDYRPGLMPGNTGNSAFSDAATAPIGDYRIRVQTINGALHEGYNDFRVLITDGDGNAVATATDVTLRPIGTAASGAPTTAPHPEVLTYLPDSGYHRGYAVFPAVSDDRHAWTLAVGFTTADQPYESSLPVTVTAQPNANLGMAAFTGSDGVDYLIALAAPQQPQVGENSLIAGIYRRTTAPTGQGDQGGTSWTYTAADGYTLLLDPRMPEPSMGNHSSPNNVDLTQGGDGLYHGTVNYTMTGNWTLNFILLGPDGQLIKGTDVPPDFTPGVAGEKSELHIDIVF